MTISKLLKKEAASSRPGGITWMRPFLSAQLHLLPMHDRCPDYEGMQHSWQQRESDRVVVIPGLLLTNGNLMGFRLSHVGANRL